MSLAQMYGDPLALLTDLYQLTMAYGYWKTGLADRRCIFHLTFREAPFGGSYAVACGLNAVVEYLRGFRFTAADLAYLESLSGADGQALFEPAFLAHLGDLRFRCDVDAIAEGTIVFPHEPLVRVTGPLLQAQILETPLLTLVNFPTLVATKAARVTLAARGRPVLEFGLRRAQGIDGGVTASRAAYVGGCAGTSNVMAGKQFGIPVKGTHAHSWVMAFDDELQAFQRYAEVLPGNAILLVDSYNSLDGVRRAIQVGRELQAKGGRLLGIRLDSGDLAHLSREARRMLDEAGFPDASVVASGDLDEYSIEQLWTDGARIDVFGVGTRLATAFDQPALGGVYKLGAIGDEHGGWSYRIKLSERDAKSSDPGRMQLRRFYGPRDRPVADMIYDENLGVRDPPSLVPAGSQEVPQPVVDATRYEDLLCHVFRAGQCVYEPPSASAARARTLQQLESFGLSSAQPEKVAAYPVGREAQLAALRKDLIRDMREKYNAPPQTD